MSNACPKCGIENQDGAVACIRCGVIFAKIKPDLSPIERVPIREQIANSPSQVVEPDNSFVVPKAVLLAAMAFYAFRLLSHPIASNFAGESFLHLVNLPFHEAGHVIFSPFGRLIQVMGGTLGQLLIPAIVCVSFFLRRDRYAAAVGLWWLGESMVDVAPYADDARAGQLPLLGGVTGSEVEDYHDWEVILGRLGILSWDHTVAKFFFIGGGLVMAAAIVLGLITICRPRLKKNGGNPSSSL